MLLHFTHVYEIRIHTYVSVQWHDTFVPTPEIDNTNLVSFIKLLAIKAIKFPLAVAECIVDGLNFLKKIISWTKPKISLNGFLND